MPDVWYLPTELEAKIFEFTPKGACGVVLANNIAETSLAAIDGIKYGVDPGSWLLYDQVIQPRTGMELLLESQIYNVSANQ